MMSGRYFLKRRKDRPWKRCLIVDLTVSESYMINICHRFLNGRGQGRSTTLNAWHHCAKRLFKLLEEPTVGTYGFYGLLTHTPALLLPTIIGGLKRSMRPYQHSQSNDPFDNTLGVKDICPKRLEALFIAQGLPAELTRLLRTSRYLRHAAAIVRDARESLCSGYARLLIEEVQRGSRQTPQRLEDAMKQLQQQSQKGWCRSITPCSPLRSTS